MRAAECGVWDHALCYRCSVQWHDLAKGLSADALKQLADDFVARRVAA